MLKEGLFVGLIPDGNRSWERQRVGTQILTHDQLLEAYDCGAEAVKRIIEAARDDGKISILALWGLSMNNLDSRGLLEKRVLFDTYDRFLKELRDEWMDRQENRSVRLVHMGRLMRLMEQAPETVDLLAELIEHTRERTGMIIALCLDYDGHDEEHRALQLWQQSNYAGGIEERYLYLDLPRQVQALRTIGKNSRLATSVNLMLRTNTEDAEFDHYNEFLHAYQNETRVKTLDVFMPDFTADMFREKIARYRSEKMKFGH